MIAPKPMDPEALDHLRYFVGQNRPSITHDLVAALLADRDHQEQRAIGAERDRDSAAEGLASSRRLLTVARSETARLRARVRVEAEDVEQARVTVGKVRAWLLLNDLLAEPQTVNGDRWAGYGYLHHADRPKDIANAIVSLARQLGRPSLDILDEMAAMEVSP